jgi:hypothetical protein
MSDDVQTDEKSSSPPPSSAIKTAAVAAAVTLPLVLPPSPKFQRIPGVLPPPGSPPFTATANRFARRKMSFPAAAPSSVHSRLNGGGYSPGLNHFNLSNISEIPNASIGLNGGSGPSAPSADAAAFNRRIRRFSNVSDAVSRKLSTTIGWRTVSVTEIVNQGKSLCGQYIRSRLKRSGVFNRKLGLQRLRSVANLPGGIIVCEVFAQLHSIGLELERLHPKLYSGVARQVRVFVSNLSNLLVNKRVFLFIEKNV